MASYRSRGRVALLAHSTIKCTIAMLAVHGALDLLTVHAQDTPQPLYVPSVIEGEADDLEGRIEALEGLLAGVSRDGNDIVVSGANVRIVNGTGATDGVANGVGNIIIGYNELRGGLNVDGSPKDVRTGSHMLIVGKGNNYSSYGGIVLGSYNDATGAWSNVVGGRQNTAEGDNAITIGGLENRAGGIAAVVVGGSKNVAEGWWSAVHGGSENASQGDYSSIGGGWRNVVSKPGEWASVAGGQQNTVSGPYSSVGGGGSLELGGNTAWAAGTLHSP